MDKVVNLDGFIAVQHYNSNPWDVKISADGTMYYFRPQHNISMAWVREEHLAQVLRITRKACCGTNPQRFHLASRINVNLWETGNRHGVPNE